MRKTVKAFALATLAGTLLQLGGCNFNYLLRAAITSAAVEFVLDNDGVFDLFEDGDVAAPAE